MAASDDMPVSEPHSIVNENTESGVEALQNVREESMPWRQSGIDTSAHDIHSENPYKKNPATEEADMLPAVQKRDPNDTDKHEAEARSITSTDPPPVQEDEFVVVQLNADESHGTSDVFRQLSQSVSSRVDNAERPPMNGTHEQETTRFSHSQNPNGATRPRNDTISSTFSSGSGHQGQTMSSMFFVVQALEAIQNSKEGKRKGPLKDATMKALGTHCYILF